MLLDRDLELLYARALISIARAEGTIDSDEGARLGERIAERSGLELADLLLERSLQPEELADALMRTGAPFRGASVRADEVGRALVEDALYVALAKGHVTPEEGHRMWRYAIALGLSADEFRALTAHWLP
ncbi:MAG TPA: TerB family tellurite resistance protein [Kofleriaceae bacterium]|nr:TerB family tellurite resistance protein [Kofleriaceae bacterium]